MRSSTRLRRTLASGLLLICCQLEADFTSIFRATPDRRKEAPESYKAILFCSGCTPGSVSLSGLGHNGEESDLVSRTIIFFSKFFLSFFLVLDPFVDSLEGQMRLPINYRFLLAQSLKIT